MTKRHGHGHGPVLPIYNAEPPKPDAFPIGSMVYLKSFPGPRGIVQRTHRGVVYVRWSDLNFTGRHRPDALILASLPDEDTEPDEEANEEENDDGE